MGRVACRLRGGHEAEVVIAVGGLGGPAGVDDVDLRGDLIVRAEPGLGDQGKDVVGIVVGEYPGFPDCELVQRAPDAVVGPGLGEVVSRRSSGRLLLGDDFVECFRGTVDDGGVTEGALEDNDARAGAQRADELGLHIGPFFRGVQVAAEAVSVDQDVLFDGVGVRIVFYPGFLGDQGDEIFKLAVAFSEPLGAFRVQGVGARGGGHRVSSLKLHKHRSWVVVRVRASQLPLVGAGGTMPISIKKPSAAGPLIVRCACVYRWLREPADSQGRCISCYFAAAAG